MYTKPLDISCDFAAVLRSTMQVLTGGCERPVWGREVFIGGGRFGSLSSLMVTSYGFPII